MLVGFRGAMLVFARGVDCSFGSNPNETRVAFFGWKSCSSVGFKLQKGIRQQVVALARAARHLRRRCAIP